jgi:hypothetical protein
LNKFTDFSVEFRQLLLVKSDDFETDRSSLVDHVGSRDDLFREYGIQPSLRVGDEWQAIPGLRSKCIESFLRFFSTYYQENNVLLFRESVGDLLKMRQLGQTRTAPSGEEIQDGNLRPLHNPRSATGIKAASTKSTPARLSLTVRFAERHWITASRSCATPSSTSKGKQTKSPQ